MTDAEYQLALCARINFQSIERACPEIKSHPLWPIAMGQLWEALGGESIDDSWKRIRVRDLSTEAHGFSRVIPNSLSNPQASPNSPTPLPGNESQTGSQAGSQEEPKPKKP